MQGQVKYKKYLQGTIHEDWTVSQRSGRIT